ncbi:hypothetical protein GNZ13_24345 [Paraburkholderia sp. 5N]|uniref:Methyl-accepting transducer domain-containing protein n=1 Tax=Paraburkholderia elongata TaxID=2675747 RepID=A0A972NQ10_9BURK|nr:methyl-accepting chemotaxis protein [Paraburkholderia elongata]NPT57618.1 hypothetical protein [Paraburkholderia elongata]
MGGNSQVRKLIGNAVGKVGSGAEQVEKAGSTIEQARDAIAKVTGFVQEIAAAATEQSAGIDQVNLAVTQMDTLTQENAALVAEATAAAHSLTEQAGILQAAMESFRVQGGLGHELPRQATAFAGSKPSRRFAAVT